MPSVESSLRASIKSYISVPKKPKNTRSVSISHREKEVTFKYKIVLFNMEKKKAEINIFNVIVNKQFSLRLFLLEYVL